MLSHCGRHVTWCTRNVCFQLRLLRLIVIIYISFCMRLLQWWDLEDFFWFEISVCCAQLLSTTIVTELYNVDSLLICYFLLEENIAWLNVSVDVPVIMNLLSPVKKLWKCFKVLSSVNDSRNYHIILVPPNELWISWHVEAIVSWFQILFKSVGYWLSLAEFHAHVHVDREEFLSVSCQIVYWK